MKILLFVLFFIVSFQNSFAVSKRNGIFVVYSEAADYFEIMENIIVGDYGPALGYQKSLRDTFLTTSEDKHWAEWYKTFRRKTSKEFFAKKENTILFSNVDTNIDFIRGTFLESERPSLAIKKLQKRLKKKELDALRKFYEHFNSKIAVIVRLSAARQAEVSAIFKQLKKDRFKTTFKRAATFFAIPKHLSKKVIMNFVWYPKSEEMKVSYGKNFITVRVHPENAGNLTKYDIMKIFMIYLMKVQPAGQKQLISSKIFDKCNPTKYFPIHDILEKSLSVVWGEMYFSYKINRKKFQLYKTWSKNPWVNTYSKLLYPLVERTSKSKHTIMSREFLDGAITTCDDLLALGKFI